MNTTFWDKLAIKSYKSMIKYKPDYALLHNNLAQAYVRLEQYPQAIRSFKKAIQCDATATDAHYHLASLVRHLGREREALVYLQEHIKTQVNKSCIKEGREKLSVYEMARKLELKLRKQQFEE